MIPHRQPPRPQPLEITTVDRLPKEALGLFPHYERLETAPYVFNYIIRHTSDHKETHRFIAIESDGIAASPYAPAALPQPDPNGRPGAMDVLPPMLSAPTEASIVGYLTAAGKQNPQQQRGQQKTQKGGTNTGKSQTARVRIFEGAVLKRTIDVAQIAAIYFDDEDTVTMYIAGEEDLCVTFTGTASELAKKSTDTINKILRAKERRFVKTLLELIDPRVPIEFVPNAKLKATCLDKKKRDAGRRPPEAKPLPPQVLKQHQYQTVKQLVPRKHVAGFSGEAPAAPPPASAPAAKKAPQPPPTASVPPPAASASNSKEKEQKEKEKAAAVAALQRRQQIHDALLAAEEAQRRRIDEYEPGRRHLILKQMAREAAAIIAREEEERADAAALRAAQLRGDVVAERAARQRSEFAAARRAAGDAEAADRAAIEAAEERVRRWLADTFSREKAAIEEATEAEKKGREGPPSPPRSTSTHTSKKSPTASVASSKIAAPPRSIPSTSTHAIPMMKGGVATEEDGGGLSSADQLLRDRQAALLAAAREAAQSRQQRINSEAERRATGDIRLRAQTMAVADGDRSLQHHSIHIGGPNGGGRGKSNGSFASPPSPSLALNGDRGHGVEDDGYGYGYGDNGDGNNSGDDDDGPIDWSPTRGGGGGRSRFDHFGSFGGTSTLAAAPNAERSADAVGRKALVEPKPQPVALDSLFAAGLHCPPMYADPSREDPFHHLLQRAAADQLGGDSAGDGGGGAHHRSHSAENGGIGGGAMVRASPHPQQLLACVVGPQTTAKAFVAELDHRMAPAHYGRVSSGVPSSSGEGLLCDPSLLPGIGGHISAESARDLPFGSVHPLTYEQRERLLMLHQHGGDGIRSYEPRGGGPFVRPPPPRKISNVAHASHVSGIESLHGTSAEAVADAAPHRPPAHEHTTSPPAIAAPSPAMQANTPMAAVMPSGAPLSRFLLPAGTLRGEGAAPSVASTANSSVSGGDFYYDSTMDGGKLLMAALGVAAAANNRSNSAVRGTKGNAAQEDNGAAQPSGRGGMAAAVPSSAVVAGDEGNSAFGRLVEQQAAFLSTTDCLQHGLGWSPQGSLVRIGILNAASAGKSGKSQTKGSANQTSNQTSATPHAVRGTSRSASAAAAAHRSTSQQHQNTAAMPSGAGFAKADDGADARPQRTAAIRDDAHSTRAQSRHSLCLPAASLSSASLADAPIGRLIAYIAARERQKMLAPPMHAQYPLPRPLTLL